MNTPSLLFFVLVMTVPARNGALRMRLWRTLKGVGAVALRDGVYLLPEGRRAEGLFFSLEAEIKQNGGEAYVVNAHARDAAMEAQFCALFDRTLEYARLLAAIVELRNGGVFEPVQQRRLRALSREFEAISAVDFFPGPAQRQVEQQLEELSRLAAGDNEPQAFSGGVEHLARGDFRSRLWATRARPWLDRLASSWLILRCIDPDASFLWLENPADCPAHALGFDFDGARFSHVGNRVSFETLCLSFGLEADQALRRMGALVHDSDLGGVPVAETAGVETIVAAMRQRLVGDDALLAAVRPLFDDLYLAFSAAELPAALSSPVKK